MKILAIGAHYDDVELNAAGTLLRARARGDEIYLVVCTSNIDKRREEQNIVSKLMGYKGTFNLGLEDGYIENDALLILMLEGVIEKVQPDLVITHTDDDFHQDHVAVSKAMRAVNRYSRFSMICFPSHDVKQPFLSNLYVDISRYFEEKLKILTIFRSQKNKPWLSKEWIESRNVGIDNFKHTEKFYIRFLKI